MNNNIIKTLIASLVVIIGLLFLFEPNTHPTKETDNIIANSNKNISETKENNGQVITLHIEDEIKNEKNLQEYIFNGFIGEDTLSFETKSSISFQSYHPAIKGYKFTMKNIYVTAEIIDFSRKKGTVTLKISNIPDTK